jgi:hypothetical protein
MMGMANMEGKRDARARRPRVRARERSGLFAIVERWIESHSQRRIGLGCLLVTLVIGYVDDSLGADMSLSVIYAMPIAIMALFAYCARIKLKLHLGSATELLRESIRWHNRQVDSASLA